MPEPWSTDSIVATFLYVTTGPDNKLRFRYMFENRSSLDYRLAETDGVVLMAKLQREKSFSGFLSKLLSVDDYPIFLPPGQRQMVDIRLPYSGPQPRPPNATKAQKDEFEKELRQLVEKRFSNLDGFVLFDHRNRYQINLPKGW